MSAGENIVIECHRVTILQKHVIEKQDLGIFSPGEVKTPGSQQDMGIISNGSEGESTA